MPRDPDIHDLLAWLGYLQPDGLVVSPAALVDSDLLFDRNTRPLQQRSPDTRFAVTTSTNPPDIPANPRRIYSESGWSGLRDWLGVEKND